MSVLLLGLLVTGGGCATTGSTVGSGVGDRLLREPPYSTGARVASGEARIAHLPIAYQRGATQPATFDPSGEAGAPVAQLLAELSAYLSALDATVPITARTAARGTPPDVHFGCVAAPGDECTGEGSAAEASTPYMRLAVGRPSSAWVQWLGEELRAADASRALVISLEVGQYWPRQRNLRGSKEVLLGTGHVQSLPWLTSLESPVSVLQLTGALVDAQGRAIRIGAEGLFARRTNLLLGAFGVQVPIGDEDVARLRQARREDLPGQPLVWEVALRNLLADLIGAPELAIR